MTVFVHIWVNDYMFGAKALNLRDFHSYEIERTKLWITLDQKKHLTGKNVQKSNYPQQPLDKIVYNAWKFVDNFWKADILKVIGLLKDVEEKANTSWHKT